MEFYSFFIFLFFFYRDSPFFPWEIEVLPALILIKRVWNSLSSGLVLYKEFCTRNQFLFRRKNIVKVTMQVDCCFVAKISVLFI